MVRVGIVGCGRIADLHVASWLRQPNCIITALCDTDGDTLASKAEQWDLNDAAAFEDHEALCQSGLVDLVEVLLPHHLHCPVALYALSLGLNVSVQKPMATSLQDADAMLEAAERSTGFLKVFENFLHYPPVVQARRIIDAGGIGEPLSIHLKSNPGDPRCGWSVPAAAQAWRQNVALSGGGPLTFDDGHHKLAIAQHLMGPIEWVLARIGATDVGGGVTLDAPAIISMGFGGGRMGVLEVVHSPKLRVKTKHYAQDDRVEVTGSDGLLQIAGGHGRTIDQVPLIHYARDGRDRRYHHLTGVSGEWAASFEGGVKNSLDALADEAEPMLTPEEGRRLLKVGLGIGQSALTGEVVRVA